MSLFIIVFFVALISTLVQSITGFGFAIVMMSFLTIFIPSDIGATLSVIFGGMISAVLFVKYRRYLNIRLLLFPALFSAIGVSAGMLIQTQTTPSLYIQLLGIFLIILSLWFLFYGEKAKMKASFGSGAVAGIISGVFGAMFSIAGPPLVLYFNTVVTKKETYMAVLQFCFTILSIIILIGRVMIGKFPMEIVDYLLPAGSGVIVGVIPGLWIHEKVDHDMLKKIVYGIMISSGLYFVITA